MPCATAALSDLAPTLLELMGLPLPPEMTGKSLIVAMIRVRAPLWCWRWLRPAPAPLDEPTTVARRPRPVACAGHRAAVRPTASDRIAALTATIRAYEDGLLALRDGLRRAALREAEIAATFDERQARLSQALGAMMVLEQNPRPLPVLLHPQGPEAAVRSGMVLSDVTPTLRSEADAMRTDLEEVA